MHRFATIMAASAMVAVLGIGESIAGKADDTLNAAFGLEMEPLDYYKIAGREGMMVARHVFDGLLYKDIRTGEILPALAVSWEFVDETTIEMQLRKDAKFHNGADFTADDVVETLNTVSRPEYGARYTITVDWIGEVEKIDDYAVRIRMSKPFAGALEMLTDVLPIYPHEYFKEVGSAGMAANPVGTGPYRVIDSTPGTRYVLERFDDYYEGSPKGKPPIKTLVFRTIPEQNTQYAELMSGRLDWIWRIPTDQADRIASRPNIDVVSGPILRFTYLAFQTQGAANSPTGNLQVRQAISHAINREAITRAFAGGNSTVQRAACNAQQFGCEQDVQQYEYDPDRARALLTEAGFPNGFDTSITFAAMPRAIAEAVAADLGKVGIRVTLNELQYAAAAAAWRNGEVPIWLANWGSYGVADVAFSTSVFFKGTSDDGAKDEQVIEWLDVGDTSPDPEVRRSNYSNALKKIAEEAYWLPMFDFNINYGLSIDLDFTPQADEFAEFWRSSWK